MYPFLKPGDRLVVKPVPPNSLSVGDIIVLPQKTAHCFIIHRLVKKYPNGNGITKGDSLLQSDSEQVELSTVTGRVEATIRGRRFISISAGPRSHMKGLYAHLSLRCLTYEAIKLKAKNTLKQLLCINKTKENQLERGFILSILREGPPKVLPKLNWVKFSEIAYWEGVAGILYLSLKGRDIPKFTLSTLENYYCNTAYSNLIYVKALEELEEALKKEKIVVMTLKGASMLDHVYTRIGMRFMEDIDLMVHPNDWERFVRLLHRMGYREQGTFSHLFVKNKVAIDLHTHALHTDRIKSREALFPCGMGPLWEKAIPWKPGFQWLKRPDNADHVLLLSQHLLQHSFSRLIWFEDIRRIMDQGNARFWEKLKNNSALFKQHKSLSYTLYLLNLLFKYEPPKDSGINALFENISGSERMLLNMYGAGTKLNHLGVFLAFFSIPGFIERIRFGWETIFPKNKVLQEEFGVFSMCERAFFYTIRFFQLINLLIKLILSIPGIMIRSTRMEKLKEFK